MVKTVKLLLLPLLQDTSLKLALDVEAVATTEVPQRHVIIMAPLAVTEDVVIAASAETIGDVATVNAVVVVTTATAAATTTGTALSSSSAVTAKGSGQAQWQPSLPPLQSGSQLQRRPEAALLLQGLALRTLSTDSPQRPKVPPTTKSITTTSAPTTWQQQGVATKTATLGCFVFTATMEAG